VQYRPVTDYTASVTAFRVGDLDLVWYGGLTGTQARLQVSGARAVAQRDIDARFRSVFVANKNSGIRNLAGVRGRTFTFGSESSTSGRLMPQFFLLRNGIRVPRDFRGQPGFSGTHDKTLALVAAGSYDAGALNEQVWKKRVEENHPDTKNVRVIYTTPPYHDYHWLLHPDAVRRFGGEPFVRRVQNAFLKLNSNNAQHADILDLFGAKRFIRTDPKNYANIERIGREAGLIAEGRRGRRAVR
jgi:phosphonate transport system substrate-binding protein